MTSEGDKYRPVLKYLVAKDKIEVQMFAQTVTSLSLSVASR